jgi:hypothetical protein
VVFARQIVFRDAPFNPTGYTFGQWVHRSRDAEGLLQYLVTAVKADKVLNICACPTVNGLVVIASAIYLFGMLF